MILIVNIHFPLASMQELSLSLLKIPLSQFMERYKPIGGIDIDFREETDDPVCEVKLVIGRVCGI
jgi:hypothetical protein